MLQLQHMISRLTPPPPPRLPFSPYQRHLRSSLIPGPSPSSFRHRPLCVPAAVAADAPPSPSTSVEHSGSGEGPVELPPISPFSSSSIFADSDSPTPLQVSTSVLLTGAISIFLFRSLRRRAKRAKEMRVRSTGVKDTKDLKKEALDNLRAMSSASLDPAKPPSPAQAFLGGLAAGVVAIILYKFTTTIEASLNRQTISDSFSVRQLTITVRTIINGLCYLATFVFGINSFGLLLYSGQLAINSFTEPDPGGSSRSNKDMNVDAASSTEPTVKSDSTINDGTNNTKNT